MSRNTCGSVEARIWTYTTDLQDKYTKNEMNAALFRDNGIDMLGPVETKTFPNYRVNYPTFPLLVKCLQIGAVWATLMEEKNKKNG